MEKKKLQSKVSSCPRNLGKNTRNIPGVCLSAEKNDRLYKKHKTDEQIGKQMLTTLKTHQKNSPETLKGIFMACL